MALYAAYGSNMDPAQMAERCPHSPRAGTGWLDGWRLTFGGEDIGWEGALATVVEDAEDPGARVFVVLYEMSEGDEQSLDRWDGATLGYYSKLRVRVEHPGRGCPGLAVRAERLRGRPAVRPLPGNRVRRGRGRRRPDDYVGWLRTRPCTSLGS